MGRWSQYDEDDYRLPEGMKRVGYDADTGRYYFKGAGGALWEGPQGANFGEMRRVSEAPAVYREGEDDDVEVGPKGPDGYAPLSTDGTSKPRARFASVDYSYRMMFPFFLIIIVFLLLVLRLVGPLAGHRRVPPPLCPDGSTPSTIVAGDTCYDIAVAHGCKLDALLKLNPSVECEKLQPGQSLCVPL